MKEMKEFLKKKKDIDPLKKESKLGVLKELKNTMSSMMGDDIKGKMMKATVAAETPEDLKKGLEKAKDIVSEVPDMEDEDTDEMDMMSDDTDSDDLDDLSTPEEIDEMIAKLQEKKQQLMEG